MSEQSIVEQVLKRTDLKEPDRFCRDCKHCYRSATDFFIGYEFAKCRRYTGEIDPVSGKAQRKNSYCSVERGDYGGITCGSKARYWTVKK